MPNGDVVACNGSRVIANVQHTSLEQLWRSPQWAQNAAAGPTCAKGCRDCGIFDLSAVRHHPFALTDAQRYLRAFLS